MASIAFYIGFYYLVIYLKSKDPRVNLWFSLMCLSIMLYDLCCVGNYNSANVLEGAGWQRLQLLTLGLVAVSLLWFVLDYTRNSTRRAAYFITGFFSFCVLAQWVDRSDLTWIVSQPLVKTFYFFGSAVTYQEVAQGLLTDLEAYGLLCFFTYVYWLSFHFYWKKDAVRGLPLLLAVTLFYLTMLEDVMVSAGFYKFIYTLEYGYIGFLLIMAYSQIMQTLDIQQRLRKSQTMLAGILNSVPQSIFWKDADGMYLGCNDNFAKAVGRGSSQEVVGKTDFDLVWSREDAEMYRADDQEVLSQNRPKRHIIEPFQQADGKCLWVDTTKAPLVDKTGRPYGILGVYEDITERKQAEERLRQSEGRYRGLVVLAVDGILLGSNDGTIIEANESFCRLIGLTKEVLIGKDIRSLAFTPESLSKVPFRFDLLRQGETVVSERTVLRPDKVEVVIEMHTKMMLDGSYQSIIRDITDRKRVEDILRKAKEDAEAASKAKSEFLTNIAHDFRTPMHAIMGFSAFFQSENLTAKQKRFANIINQKSKGLLALVDDLLDVSRLESGRLELRACEFDLKDCVRSVFDMSEAVLADKDVKMTCFVEDGIPLLKADAVRLAQVLSNLMDNAVKYTDHGEIVVKVERIVEGYAGDKCRLRFSVKDTGIGIEKGRQAQLFDAFARSYELEGARERGGAGLGLYIVKALIDLMGGTISLLSEVGVGSEFIVTLDLGIV